MTDAAPLDAVPAVLAYHARTKHHLNRYAAGPGSLDWDAQPDPFRHWQGTRRYDLPRHSPELDIAWAALNDERPPAAINIENLGTLLRLTAAITAWKQYGGSRWALRANPSSGNLHPTETWAIVHWMEGLADGLYHYQGQDHALEWRASSLAASDSAGVWLGFSSIHWREAWKYGERAFRYCQLDMGHMLAAVAYAAALFGWQPRLVRLSPEDAAHCLGTDRHEDYAGVETEEAEVIVALHAPEAGGAPTPPLAWDEWSGVPSLLDPKPMYHWPVIDEVAEVTRGQLCVVNTKTSPLPLPRAGEGEGAESPPATQVILQRRSAQAFDGKSVIPLAVFRRMLACLLPGGSPVWTLWPHASRVHPILLVHRVEGIAPGLYALPRTNTAEAALREGCRAEFTWQAVDPDLPLFLLVQAAAAKTARTLSCHQDIASHSAFTLMFVAEFAAPIAENPAAYRHLHWEAGMLGHVVGLEAEAAGWHGTGIGCFFDDADHDVLGLTDNRFQVLYHFAVGMPVDDPRLMILPAYE
jgi:SagB-type dehydrogenase family enzyme